MSNPSKYLGLLLEDLQAIAQVRGIKDYESVSIDKISNIIFPLEKAKKAKKAEKSKKQKTSFSKARIKEIREKFNESRYKFSSLYKIKKGKNLSKSKMKEI